MLKRRTFLRNVGVASAGLLLRHSTGGWAEMMRTAQSAPVPLPADFLGLGYEMSSVATPDLLSAGNEQYVRLVRQLGAGGVMRVGGIVADYTRYFPDAPAVHEPHRTVINRAALEQFAGFLRKTKWTAIWSLPFAQGTLAEAAAEAQAVADVLGRSLLAFELGNEVENYARGSHPFRPAPYTYQDYRTEYLRWHDRITQVVPGARFAAPDTAGDVSWVEQTAQDVLGPLRGKVQLLTTHYYRNEQHHGSAEQLREPDPALPDRLTRLRAAAAESGIPWRMCETNSFSGGGLPGVSDSLLGALWTLDYLLLLARHGCSGVNLQTGVNQLGFLSSYSPIRDSSAGAPYYGMLAFAAARRGCTHSIAVTLQGLPDTLTAYALGRGERPRSLVLINRGDEVSVPVRELPFRPAASMLLAADSTGSLRLGGAAVAGDGRWHPTRKERVLSGTITVASMSAVVVRR